MVGSEAADSQRRGRPLLATAAQQFPAPSTESKRSRTRSREPDEAKERIDQEPELNMRKEEEDKIRNIKMAVEDEFAKVIPADSLKMIKKVSLELASKIEQLQKTNSRITQHEKDIESLKTTRVPNGMKPVSFPYETPFLDSLMFEESSWHVEIPKETTLRDAKKIIHCSYLHSMRKIDLMIARAQRTDLRKATKKSEFVNKCSESFKSKVQTWRDLDLDFEEEEPEANKITTSMVESKASNVYDKTVDQAAALVKKRKDHLKFQEKKKQDMVNKMLQKTPEELLKQTIDARIRENVKHTRSANNSRDRANPHLNSASAFVATTSGSAAMADDPVEMFWVERAKQNKKKQDLKGGKGKGKGKDKGNSAGPDTSKGASKGMDAKGTKNKGAAKGKTSKGPSSHPSSGASKSFLGRAWHHAKKGKGKGGKPGKGKEGKGKGKAGWKKGW